VRFPLVLALAIVWSACAPTPPPAQPQTAPDLTAEAWYPAGAEQLAAISREAGAHLQAGRFDEAAAAITKGQPLQARLLKATRPTLAAMEAASDLDDAYGRMLLHNGHTGWARDTFQKNVVRWKTWKPQTPETERRYKTAVEAVAVCDQRL
jgi:hypothetical protein